MSAAGLGERISEHRRLHLPVLVTGVYLQLEVDNVQGWAPSPQTAPL